MLYVRTMRVSRYSATCQLNISSRYNSQTYHVKCQVSSTVFDVPVPSPCIKHMFCNVHLVLSALTNYVSKAKCTAATLTHHERCMAYRGTTYHTTTQVNQFYGFYANNEVYVSNRNSSCMHG